MKFAILILAHQYSVQVTKLVTGLIANKDTWIFIYVDKRSTELYQEIKKEFKRKKGRKFDEILILKSSKNLLSLQANER